MNKLYIRYNANPDQTFKYVGDADKYLKANYKRMHTVEVNAQTSRRTLLYDLLLVIANGGAFRIKTKTKIPLRELANSIIDKF